jgi:hypothetical protein
MRQRQRRCAEAEHKPCSEKADDGNRAARLLCLRGGTPRTSCSACSRASSGQEERRAYMQHATWNTKGGVGGRRRNAVGACRGGDGEDTTQRLSHANGGGSARTAGAHSWLRISRLVSRLICWGRSSQGRRPDCYHAGESGGTAEQSSSALCRTQRTGRRWKTSRGRQAHPQRACQCGGGA